MPSTLLHGVLCACVLLGPQAKRPEDAGGFLVGFNDLYSRKKYKQAAEFFNAHYARFEKDPAYTAAGKTLLDAAEHARDVAFRKTMARVDYNSNRYGKFTGGGIIADDSAGRGVLQAYPGQKRFDTFVYFPSGMTYMVGPSTWLEFEVYYEGPANHDIWIDIRGPRKNRPFARSILRQGKLESGAWQTKTLNVCRLALGSFRGGANMLPEDGDVFGELAVSVLRANPKIRHLAFRGFHFYEEDKLERIGAPINALDVGGLSRLQRASLAGDSKAVARLLERGAGMEVRSKMPPRCVGETALIMAARGGSAEAVRLLLDAGAEIHAKDNRKYTALHLAAYSGHADVAKLLLKAGARMDDIVGNTITPPYWAVLHGYRDVVEVFLDHGLNPNSQTGGSRLLDIAAEGYRGRTYPEIVKLLLARGATPDLRAAVVAGDMKKVTELLKKDPEAINRRVGKLTPLFAAAASGNMRMVKLLLTRKADVNGMAANGTALHAATRLASARGREALVIATLLASVRGLNVNATDSEKHTPLYYAKRSGMKKLAAFLSRLGAVSK